MVEQVVDLRNKILRCQECKFNAFVTADYGDSTCSFTMQCTKDSEGNMNMVVLEPETISGITANIKAGRGQLTFEDKALAFELVADGQITPISAPWLFVDALSSGYINICGKDEEKIRAQIDDTFSGVQFSMDIWLKEDLIPIRAEVIWQGRRIMSIDIDDFTIV